MENFKKKIEQQLEQNDIVVYIKGTADNPLCGFSAQVIHILNLLKINYTYINVLEDDKFKNALKLYSNWPTFPQVYYKKKLIGGADIISELYKQKKLKDKLS